MKVPRSILKSVRECYEKWGPRSDGPIVLGLSGGKDSLTLALALQTLGIDVRPVIIDMGYKNFDATQIRDSVCQLGITATVIGAKSRNRNLLGQLQEKRLQSNLRILGDPTVTIPCGACSASKRMLLVAETKRIGASTLVLAHQREDFIATLLKDYFIHRYYLACGAYDPARFHSFISSEPIELGSLSSMVRDGLAATMALRLQIDAGVDLIRPLALVAEHSIEEFARAAKLPIAGSGCSHEAFAEANCIQSKREIVHAELRSRLKIAPSLGDQLIAVALGSLFATGRPRGPSPRSKRAIMLPGFESESP